MPNFDYHFVTHWRVKGPIQKIYEILKDGRSYSRWWRPAYVSSEEVEPRKIEALVRAKLPYTLRFTTEVIHEDPPHEFKIRASGELEGTGLWKLHQDGEMTEVTFFWDVRAQKTLVRWLSFLLKPLFIWNHDWVMKTGETALQAEVNRL